MYCTSCDVTVIDPIAFGSSPCPNTTLGTSVWGPHKKVFGNEENGTRPKIPDLGADLEAKEWIVIIRRRHVSQRKDSSLHISVNVASFRLDVLVDIGDTHSFI